MVDGRWQPIESRDSSRSPHQPSSTMSSISCPSTGVTAPSSSRRTTRPPTKSRVDFWCRSSPTKPRCASEARSWPGFPTAASARWPPRVFSTKASTCPRPTSPSSCPAAARFASTFNASAAFSGRNRTSARCSTSSSLLARPKLSPVRGGASTVLTADHVLARRRGAELVIRPLAAPERAEAALLAAQLIPVFQEGLGRSREEIETELGSIEVPVRQQRLKDGLVKLLEDRCGWGADDRIDPARARREVFLKAAQVRAALADGEPFDRASVLASVAESLAVDADALERALYADLRAANVLSEFDAPSAPALVEAYDRGQVQAVLLRAVSVNVTVQRASAAAARSLFRRLKFLGLLYTVERAEDGYRLIIDGPLSLFQSVTKYGHRIAQLMPLLEAVGAFTLEAELRWGKERVPLTFRTRGVEQAEPRRAPTARDELTLSDDLAELVRAFRALETGFRVSPGRVVLDLPGTGLCVPDLVFVRGKETIYFEALGYWSREAVFRRVDLVERGLAEKSLFAVSGRLRVSEEVIADDAPAALYVYKGAMKARAIADRLERLASRASVDRRD